MHWSFAKYVGCGNDFILFDNRQSLFPFSQPAVIQRLCHRQQGIGADGIIFLENSSKADFRMRIFNCDGTEAEMCGNGLRCFVKWLASNGFQLPTYRIETMHQILTASKLEENVCIDMGQPIHIQWNIPLTYEEKLLYVHHLNTGVPHTILFVSDIQEINLIKLGRYIRHHSLWMPKGTNVTIAQQTGPQRFKVRTYERGVEGETLSCGTGAVAAALAAAHQYRLLSPLTIETLAGEELKVGFLQEQGRFSKILLTGPAQLTFKGEIVLENERISSFSIACNSVNSVKS